MEAKRLHQESIVFDGHCDTLLAVLTGKRRLGERSNEGHLDLPRMREGGVTAQIFAICTCSRHLPSGPLKQALRMLDAFYRELADNPDSLVLATSAADIERAKGEGKVAAILGLEAYSDPEAAAAMVAEIMDPVLSNLAVRPELEEGADRIIERARDLCLDLLSGEGS